jgi:hypothetical protein
MGIAGRRFNLHNLATVRLAAMWVLDKLTGAREAEV